MKVLVTGSSGFIGKAFCEKLKDNYKIINYDFPDDILDEENLKKSIKKSNIVVHMAAIADLNDSAKDNDKNFEVNIRGTYNIAKYCAKYNKKLLFISTCCVYGNSYDKIENEESYPNTKEVYACSKMAGEYIIKGMVGLNYIIARIGTTYGIGQRDNLFTAIAFEKIINNKTIHIHGDGKQTRNLIYIDDLVNGLIKSVNYLQNVDCNEIINICGDEEISVWDVINIVKELTHLNCKYVHMGDRYGQIKSEKISICKASKLLNWYPLITFYDGMTKIYEYYLNKLKIVEIIKND